MKKVKRVYNWHYWVKIDPDTQFQVVIPETCYCRAQKVVEKAFLSYWRRPKITFQFGEIPA